MEFKQAERMEKVEPSATREVFSKCVALMQQNIPYTALTLGEPDFPTPAYIVDACKEALDISKGKIKAKRYDSVKEMMNDMLAVAEDEPEYKP